MNNEIENIFILLNENNIDYMILRDYDNINNSTDIDIYVNKKDKKKINDLLIKNMWKTPHINDNKYPHKQYLKIINHRVIKLDLVFGLIYGNNEYKIDIKSDNYKRIKSKFYVPREDLAIIMMMYHMIYDKRNFSSKNIDILRKMMDEYNTADNKNNIAGSDDIIKLVNEILEYDNIDVLNNEVISYQERLNACKYAKKIGFKRLFLNIAINIKRALNRVYKIVRKSNIAFVGLDGAGKSSAIENLNKVFCNSSFIEYMGLRDFSFKLLDRIIAKENNGMKINKTERILRLFLLYIDMLKRYFRRRFKSKIILFDRYVNDYHINSYGKMKIIYKFLFLWLFPKTKKTVYLYCDINTSLKRKNDIKNIESFTIMKKRYDKFFINKKRNVCISTDLNTLEETNTIIENYVFNMFYDYL